MLEKTCVPGTLQSRLVPVVMETWWTSHGLQEQAHGNGLEVAKAEKWPQPRGGRKRGSWELCEWFELSSVGRVPQQNVGDSAR